MPLSGTTPQKIIIYDSEGNNLMGKALGDSGMDQKTMEIPKNVEKGRSH